jgi:uncharacterized protein YecE (DUF72 family)
MSWVRNPLAAPNFSNFCDCGSALPRVPKASPTPVPVAAPKSLARLYAGTSGWAYPTWKPEFYPARTPAKKFLEFYASQLTSVEVNYTFRTLPTAKIGSWFDEKIYAILREHQAAVCIAESDDLLTPEVHTAESHTCYRLRRSSGYSAIELDAFAQRFALLAQQRDVYVYFKHEDEPTGALNALQFLGRIRAHAEKG